MSSRLLRILAIVDVVGVPLFIGWYIWRLQFTAPRSWVVFAVWLPASFILHHDTFKTMGWRSDNLWPATKQAAVAFGLMATALFFAGVLLHAPWHIPSHLVSPRRLWSYFAFCILQQVALNSFLNNRLMFLIRDRRVSSLVAGAIFAACHWPNPVLLPLTLIGGAVMAWLFARHRNIVPLAIGQAILGSLAWWSFPLAWHHHLRVGPAYYLLL